MQTPRGMKGTHGGSIDENLEEGCGDKRSNPTNADLREPEHFQGTREEFLVQMVVGFREIQFDQNSWFFAAS